VEILTYDIEQHEEDMGTAFIHWLQLVLKACEVEDEFLMKLMSSLVDQSAIW